MRVLIIGCGRLGAGLALELFRKGNEVTVIDKNPDSFFALGSEFNGNTVVGIGFDKDVLEAAGIQFQDAVICSTKSDEANALSGRIAKDIYMIPHVITRLYDPMKARIFETLGMKTISTTGYGVKRAIELLSFGKLNSFETLGENGEVELIRILATTKVQGQTVKALTDGDNYRLLAIVRGATSFMPKDEETIKSDDILYFSVKAAAKQALKSALGL